MTELDRQLRAEIALQGPMTVARYMAAALSHPRHGYYITRDPLGIEGDFITAPEVSQMFGELIGLWCVDAWQRIGGPATVRLVEIGPGRGTLMVDALRAMAAVPDCRDALDVHLVETSPTLREVQAAKLDGVAVTWHREFQTVPDGPLLLIANELFDALPIHQFVRRPEGWRERLVDAAPGGDGLRFVLAPGPTPAAALIGDDLAGAPIDSVAELSPVSISLAHDIARRIAAFDGAGLLIDYGTARGPLGDTLQAVRRHGYHDVLVDPGSADLSARVDFATLSRAIDEAGARAHGPVAQGDLLCALGIETRAAALKQGATASQSNDIDTALSRLIGAGEMGSLFMAMAVTATGAAPPAGFET